ncbi:GNAT family protein [Dermatophilaceae bacterium Sec6.4]
METSLMRLDPTGADREPLVTFLTSNEFPFHVGVRRTAAEVGRAIDAGAYRDGDNDSYWVEHEQLGRVGLLRFEELSDGNPMFDLRLAESMRGRGLGAEALRAATAHIFTSMPDVHRFEGQTREDNIAMRRTFLRCGFLKEAHYRQGWPVTGGAPVASVAYAILRGDWQTGVTTPFTWEDLTR